MNVLQQDEVSRYAAKLQALNTRFVTEKDLQDRYVTAFVWSFPSVRARLNAFIELRKRFDDQADSLGLAQGSEIKAGMIPSTPLAPVQMIVLAIDRPTTEQQHSARYHIERITETLTGTSLPTASAHML